MKRILKDSGNANTLLNMVSDTLILMDKNGICVDISIFNINLWFLKEERLLGKNLLKMLPRSTYIAFYREFRKVVDAHIKSTQNYELTIGDETYFCKCIMQPYNDMVLCQYRDITARSQQKLELERRNRELCEIQKVALIGRWSYSTETHFFNYSGHTNIIYDDEEQQISLETYLSYVIPEDKEIFTSWFKQNLEEDITDSIDYRIQYKEKVYYMRTKTYSRECQKDGYTTLEGYIQNFTDIQQRRNDISLLTHAIDNSTEDIVAIHENGDILFANRRYKYHRNIDNSEDITQLKVYDISSYAKSITKWNQVLNSVNKEINHTSYITSNPFPGHPEITTYESNLYKVTSDQGVETLWVFGRDISQRVFREQQIKQFSQILNRIIENLPAAITVKDINNEFKYIYQSCDLYNKGINIPNTEIKDDFDFYPAGIAKKEREEDIYVAETGKEKHYIVEKQDSKGRTTFLDKRKMRIESSDFSPVLLCIEWNITDMEMMKQELLAEKEKAETSDHLKSAFLANMSHEIRTPLNAIVGFSRIIAENENAEERKNYYNIVEANNERLLQLINEILDLSKIESGIVEFRFSAIKLYPLFKEIFDAHVFRCPHGVELIFDPSDENIDIEIDKNRLFQVMSNLIGNAFKFTHEGSIHYGYKRKGNKITFYVTDTGCGIAPEKLEVIFQRFIKANNFAQGTGLGLSICKTIVEKLGGTISAKSKLGKGTTFTFTLPLQQSTNGLNNNHYSSSSKVSDNVQQTVANKLHNVADDINKEDKALKTILVAEDIDSNFILVESILGSCYHLLHAKDGIEAVNLYKEASPDLILMDIKMPNLTGLEATIIIREQGSKVPIIALTAFAFDDDRKIALETGCDDFLAKPFKAEELKSIINKWLK